MQEVVRLGCYGLSTLGKTEVKASGTWCYLLSLSAFSAVLVLSFLSLFLLNCSPSLLMKSMVSEIKVKLYQGAGGGTKWLPNAKYSLALRALLLSALLLHI